MTDRIDIKAAMRALRHRTNIFEVADYGADLEIDIDSENDTYCLILGVDSWKTVGTYEAAELAAGKSIFEVQETIITHAEELLRKHVRQVEKDKRTIGLPTGGEKQPPPT